MERRVSSTPGTRARTSLPPEETEYRRICRNSTASPEVISSLISALAIISAPAKQHFDDLPKAACPSNYRVDSNGLARTVDSDEERSTSLLGPGGSGIGYGVYNDSRQSCRDVQVHPFGVAIPPIIRTSRPPSSLSPLTLSKRNSLDSRQELPSPSSTIAAHISPKVIPNSPLIPSRTSSIQRSRDKPMTTSAYESGPEIAVSPKMIPIRDSSLRHSFGSSLRTKERRSQVYEKQGMGDHQETLTAVGQPRIIMAEEVSDDPAEDEVSKRIEELRAQRLLRNQRLANEAVGPPPEEIVLVSNSLPLNPRSPLVKPENRSALVDTTAVGDSKTKDSQPQIEQNHYPTSLTDVENRQPSSPKHQPRKGPKFQLRTSPGIDRSQSVSKRSSISRPKLVLRATNPESYRRTPSMPFSQAVRTSQYDDRPSTADSVDDAVDDFLSASRLSRKVHHPQTGRIISFSEVGDPNGSTVFCCVGMGLTRYLTAFYDDLAVTLKLRLITPDRPGVGESEAYADRSDTPLGWSGDAIFGFRTRYSC